MAYIFGVSAAVLQDKVFQALADPSRRAIFESLTRGEAAVKDLTARFDISQPAVSQHLAALKDAGITYQFKVYPGTQHAFNNDTGPRYNEEQAIAAWNDTLAWFAQYLV